MLPLLSVAHYAAERHRHQRRKDADGTPYINHPLHVASLLEEAGITDELTLAAALLHDVVEDTPTTLAELATEFGQDVAAVVAEVTDDRALPKAERKRLQVEHAPHRSQPAKLVKLADKLSNLSALQADPPNGWDADRQYGYALWGLAVVRGLRGTCRPLEDQLEDVFRRWGLSLDDDPALYADDLEAYYRSMAQVDQDD